MKMNKCYIIKAHMQSYWHIGTGRGAGQNLDALVDKDPNGLPIIPGKMVKGMFRDAFYRLEAWQHIDRESTTKLFGTRNDHHGKTTAGQLLFSALSLPEADYLAQHPQLIAHLYSTHSSTAIDHGTGIAKDKSLRSQQVSIPLSLQGSIEWQPESEEPQLLQKLQLAASLITHIGANKSRGYGEVNWEITACNN